MTNESPPDTGIVDEHYCPTCEPERDPIGEGAAGRVVTVRYCSAHEPPREGPDDARVGPGYPRTGSGEAEGADCAAMADLIRRSEVERVVGVILRRLACVIEASPWDLTRAEFAAACRQVAAEFGA